MKKIALLLSLFIGVQSFAQESSDKYQDKVETLDATINTLYGVISGEAGEARDWDLMRHLFHPNGKLIASGKNREGKTGSRWLTVDDYINSSGPYIVENGFFENELNREVQQFGNIAQVFSTYECFHSSKDAEPFMRGINSIQLMFEGTRWWVMNIYWTQETEDNPIPKEFLSK